MIQAKIVADSITPTGDRLTTLEVVMPRYILAEFNTHRMLSKNSASSRAIPVKKMIKSVEENLFTPYSWQKEHTGMQGTEYITDETIINKLIKNHYRASQDAIERVEIETELGATKQNANRKLEPFMYHKVLVSGTEWENFFNLRCPQYSISNENVRSWKELTELKKDLPITYKNCVEATVLDKLQHNKGQADIHMMFLAEAIYDAMNESTPNKLEEGEWHIPYGDNIDVEKIKELYKKTKASGYNPDNPTPDAYYYDAIDNIYCKISIARCARLSYQTLGDNSEINYEKDLELYDILSKSGHWSPFEHVAKVMTTNEYNTYLKGRANNEGDDEYKFNIITVDMTGWCRNYRGFIQYRELLDN